MSCFRSPKIVAAASAAYPSNAPCWRWRGSQILRHVVHSLPAGSPRPAFPKWRTGPAFIHPPLHRMRTHLIVQRTDLEHVSSIFRFPEIARFLHNTPLKHQNMQLGSSLIAKAATGCEADLEPGRNYGHWTWQFYILRGVLPGVPTARPSITSRRDSPRRCQRALQYVMVRRSGRECR